MDRRNEIVMKNKTNLSQTNGTRMRTEQIAEAEPAIPIETLPHDQLQQLIHKLQLKQIELEIQNEKLKRAQADLKRAEEEWQARAVEIEHSRNVLLQILESIPLRVFWKDIDSKYLGCNTQFVKDSGLNSPDELLGKTDHDMGWKNQAGLYRADDQEVMRSGLPKLEIVEPQTTPTGETIWLRTSKVPLKSPSGEVWGIMGLYEDITKRKQAEEKSSELEKQLRQAQKLETVGTLAGGIAHDFNNILVPILLYTSELLAHNKENTTIRQYLLEIKTAALRARDLVRHILTFSRQHEIDPSNIELLPVIEEAAKLCRATLPSTITLDVQCDCQDCRVFADSTQIYQVLMNLCTNAYHAIGSDGGTILIRLEREQVDEKTAALHPLLHVGGYIVLSVEDSGSGIAPAILEHIFDPFYTTKEIGQGTGLGLSVVHGIVQSHGGDILVKTQIGSGTTFSVYLPLVAVVEIAPIKEKPEVSSGTGHVLLIDDEPMITLIGMKSLERFGYRVTTINCGDEAVKLFEAQPEKYDIVITDMAMPHMTGDQMLRALRRIRPNIPVLVMTGFSAIVNEENFKSLGFNGYIQKPMLPMQLHEAIQKALKHAAVSHL
jgi:two-component system cell cycle sensor histidine kinase/response regulator CckA